MLIFDIFEHWLLYYFDDLFSYIYINCEVIGKTSTRSFIYLLSGHICEKHHELA